MCENCEEDFESIKDLRCQKQENNSCQGSFQCEECDKSFRIKQQLEAYAKIHQKYPCDDCDKVFKYEVTLEKHIEAAHEDL